MKKLLKEIIIKKTLSFLIALLLISCIGIVPAMATENEETEYKLGESLCDRCGSEICECTGEDITESTYSIASVWNPTMPLPSRRLTAGELNAWIAQYNQAGISATELEILRLTNLEREKAGVLPLSIYPDLFRAARFKSQEMMDLRYFDHISPTYGAPTPLSQLFTGTTYGVGENIVWGYPSLSAAKAMQLWMDSPGHRAAILNPRYQSIGIGYIGSNATGFYGTQHFSTYSPPVANKGEITQFVERLYRLALGRNPDTAGLNHWINMLETGRGNGSGVAYGFVFSPEFHNRKTSDDTFVDIMYSTLLNRNPDTAGKAYWVNQLRAGITREIVFTGFVNSPEFDGLCRNAGIVRGTHVPPTRDLTRVFAYRLYRDALAREPDQLGIDYWHALLLGGVSGTSVAYGFIFSNEMMYDRNLSNADFVEVLYKTLLGRASDAAGKAQWVGYLNRGVSRQEIFYGFAASVEFGMICEAHGVRR